MSFPDLIYLFFQRRTVIGLGAFLGLFNFFHTSSNIGINFFPVQGVSDQCDFAEHDPLQVPFGELTTHAPTLIVALENQSPTGTSTPTYPALRGALGYATDFKDANPSREVIVVLITDLTSQNQLNITNYSSGTYILRIVLQGKSREWKIIKQD